jgi:Succinylglutamate desuccinylase / Aspartoacylase family
MPPSSFERWNNAAMRNIEKMNEQRKIIVIGGLHGDETLGIDLVNLIRKKPITGIDAIFGNPMAASVNARYIDLDLNRVFPGKLDGCLEEARAYQIMKMVRGYDLIIDFHNTKSDHNDCGFVGEEFLKETLQLSLGMGLNRIVVANYDCINKFLPNCLSIEISYSSDLNNADYWHDKLASLSCTNIQGKSLDNLQLFKFIDRLDGTQSKRFNLNFKSFESISRQDKLNLGISEELDIFSILVTPDLSAGKYCALVEKTFLSVEYMRGIWVRSSAKTCTGDIVFRPAYSAFQHQTPIPR